DGGDVEVALTGDISAEGDRADEVDADRVAAECAGKSVCQPVTERGDLVRGHSGITGHGRAASAPRSTWRRSFPRRGPSARPRPARTTATPCPAPRRPAGAQPG